MLITPQTHHYPATRFSCFGRTRMYAGLLMATALLAGCAPEPDTLGQDTGYASWDEKNDPRSVDPSFVINTYKLPVAGQATGPAVPGYTWPMHLDSANLRWDGDESLSPTEKYAAAFDQSPIHLEQLVSSSTGIDSLGATSCTEDFQCAGDPDPTTICAKRRGEDSGYCMPTWWSQIAHGAVSYGVWEQPALRSVEHNGITFYPSDLQALFSLVMAANPFQNTTFVSARCNDLDVEIGDLGAYADAACRDMNPGTLHVIAANLLGDRKRAFVQDRNAGPSVANHIVRSFSVLNLDNNGALTELSEGDAAQLIGLPSDEYTANGQAERYFHVRLQLDYLKYAAPSREAIIDDDDYIGSDVIEYVLEADAVGDVIGGEYVGASKLKHPDFLWWPNVVPEELVVSSISLSRLRAVNEQAK